MIPLKDQELIREKFAQELSGPVKIDLFTERELGITVPGRRPCQFCKQTQEMLQELSGLHDMVSLRVHYMEDKPAEAQTFGVERVPCIVLRGLGEARLKFYGLPGGMEFPGFLETIVDVSRGEVILAEESVAQLTKITKDITVRVFVTPTCPYCPAMARAAYHMAMLNPKIHSEVIEISEFPELAERYGVRAVPLTVIADRVAIPGMAPEPALVEQVVKAAESAAGAPEAAEEPAVEPIQRGKERPSGLIIP